MPDVDLDTAACKRPQVFQATKDVFGDDHCLNIITFRTESTKAAVLTACRGLGIDSDTAKELSSLVPVTRGRVWSIKELLNGNEDNGYVPIHTFVRKVAEQPMLLETMQEIEGLVCGRGSHASAEIIYNSSYQAHNSLMQSPKGIHTTCWDMGDSEACSALKEDFLTIEALDKMMVCLNFLLRDGLIEWQGSLKATYDKYLHPDVIDYTSPEMWRMMADGEIPDLFQMQTDVGGEAIKRIRPTSLKEMSLTNAVMRLSANDDMSPIDRFIAFKNDITLWYKEMRDAGLNSDEIATLEKYLKVNYGCSIEQEDIMVLVMDEKISGFDMKWANKLRKGLAKKKKALIDEVTAEYYKKGHELGTRRVMLDYVFKYCINPQLGYSFSANHDLPYSCIAIQEANLYYRFPHIYWQCAVLTVNASANEDNEDNKSTNYGKMASAVSNLQSQGVRIVLPDINRAQFGFSPDAENNQIIFGLKAISGVGDDDASQILNNRPYSSLHDFIHKNPNFGVATMTALIKAGCFDTLENMDRQSIMYQYLLNNARDNNPPRQQLNMRNFKSVDSLGLIPQHFDFQRKLTHYRSYVFSKDFMLDKDTYRCDLTAQIFFENTLFKFFKECQDYEYRDNQLILFKKPFEKFYKTAAKDMVDWISSPTGAVVEYNKAVIEYDVQENWSKYCSGKIPEWEMDSLSFYYTSHELANVAMDYYDISTFADIPPDPVVVGTSVRKVRDKATGELRETVWDKYALFRIAGTVLDKNKNKHSITLLTTDGVVIVKFYAEAFAHYDKQISTLDNQTGKKTVIEKSWLKRGNKLLITGIRRGDTFYPKKYRDSIYQHTICLISKVYDNGQLELQLERQLE